ncbi:MBL fold metallo-hydrolase RNA specificity domain-containing protein [Streptomyces sp. ML-6]|uniref:MBL fold metallo-hydrolase RNA specificity domain-containing protein n=1 Tax=Streptomyces sp. ML-6 TaxID=2982693 RepID=UPI0024BFF3A5|nr:MBL fold metallo-hydrolase RNA specificity domain-containing protein [Streptomyces sp. ML-6]MDK0517852.1 hypothetical protein [Streptomyces sp. ML-6]
MPVRAEVTGISHFCARAEAGQVVDWFRGARPPPIAPRVSCLVHGEPAASEAPHDRIDHERGRAAVVPARVSRSGPSTRALRPLGVTCAALPGSAPPTRAWGEKDRPGVGPEPGSCRRRRPP